MKMRESGRLGMSLPQIALIFIILSAVAGGVGYLQPTKKAVDDAIALNAKLDKIEEAIYSFFLDKGYLPCPASGTALDGTTTFGAPTDCNAAVVSGVTEIQPGTVTTTIRNGVVPVRALNLPDNYMYDPWGNRINYSVLKKAAIDKTTFSDLQTAITEDIFKIREENDNQLNTLFSATNQIFITHVIYSNGKNRKGGTNSSGITSSCTAGTADYENCNGDNIFRHAAHSYLEGATYYDDFIRWYTNKQLYYCSGATNGCNIPPAGFTPNSIYGLIAWIDISDYGMLAFYSPNRVWWLTEKSSIGNWYDAESTEQYMPLYEETGFNNKPTLNMTGSKGLFYCPDNPAPISIAEKKDMTIFFVGKQNATAGANYLLTSNMTTAMKINLNDNGSSNWYTYSTDSGTLSTSYSGNMYASFVFNITAPSPQAKAYVNGVHVLSANTYAGFKLNNFFTNIGIGRNKANPTDCDFDGKLSEFLIYKRALTDSERQYVENYLKAKWGL